MGRKPRSLEGFIGQRRQVRLICRLIKGAKAKGEPCRSLLLVGPSGVGKTLLARAIAKAYGSTLHPVFGGKDLRPVHICSVLAKLRHADFLFIDEAQTLDRETQEILYLALDDNKIPAEKDGHLDRGRFESIAEFSLILATNEPGRVRDALRARLKDVQFGHYAVRELIEIAKAIAAETSIGITPQAARLLAKVARGLPRLIRKRLDELRHYWPGVILLTREHVARFLARNGIDEYGCELYQRKYLRFLAGIPKGLSLKGLAARLGVDARYVEVDIEPFLIDKGWVDVGSGRGRRITDSGRDILRHFMATTNKGRTESENA